MSIPLISVKKNPFRHAIENAYYADETTCVKQLMQEAFLPAQTLEKIEQCATQLIEKIRAERLSKGGLDAFLYEYDLSSEEGIALMCLAEALLRIPDAKTVDALLEDKITHADWASHLGQSPSLFVNASTWGLVLTGKLFQSEKSEGLGQVLGRFIRRTSAPVIRKAIKQAMQQLGRQFVMGETIDEALKRAKTYEAKGYCFSYDMLGEAARTEKDAERYFKAYQTAIAVIGKNAPTQSLYQAPGISVKLSALHPRYEFAKKEEVVPFLTKRLKQLTLAAKDNNMTLTVDAEEADRLDMSLDIIEAVFCDQDLAHWEGLGLAVQAYQKRAPYVIDWLIDLAKKQHKRWMVRLIKGAYWDTEIKNAQIKGVLTYPVFTRKAATDVCFVACAKKLLAHTAEVYPQFATHNAYTFATLLELAGKNRDFEMQCLHGMGYTLYDSIVGSQQFNIPCRVYAPVGEHEDLLAYLVRRLLENGANTSFVNRIVDESIPIETMLEDPVRKLASLNEIPHPKIPLPPAIYAPDRKNSRGIDFSDSETWEPLAHQIEIAFKKSYRAGPILKGGLVEGEKRQAVRNPSNPEEIVGHVSLASEKQLDQALSNAYAMNFTWTNTPLETRAASLERAADRFEQRFGEFMALVIKEGGKTLPDAVAEVREAIDFCRYYALRARKDLIPQHLPGPTGEENWLRFPGRGVIACISPWNFPLAIFIGQVTAALVAGNTVIAKPASQTPCVATEAVKLLHEVGIPVDALQLLPARGSVIGPKITDDPRIKGIIFTGSTETAREINQRLAHREGGILPFIAETGGQNAMIVDTSALKEQVVVDVLISAFGSAGQRCSALRVLYLQEEMAESFIEMLIGAMATLKVGDPSLLFTDVGPVIDSAAKKTLQEHFDRMCKEAKLLYQCTIPRELDQTHFFAPCLFELKRLDSLTREVFGPILHVIRYSMNDREKVINEINNTGYGLTLGIQSRIQHTVESISRSVHAGNQYVNRSMVGAVVGVQPFGGEGLSGTGPKAGGPHYLPRLCLERSLSINTTAAGGNASLLCLED
ncbi:bifunctional proline dehydrogenase/L-glutamate gamma-semialdehyde dehydrogenase PutA [Rickettsiella grylli]|uniref:Bifunctional protein PutA n=1 Tax=Rickettsiella grylli TaxID=59196 RepID=A8PLW6_9COXI|nr:bifunctional proline dehydrogenase/L-glutamate gamma-semialdehyde dehydrogenase PutA [Rickettsiella grylli]EDP45660.1 bifunctional protein PutA [Rickettsiella grylli]